MTKYVISGYIGFDNFGDEAIAGVLTDYLKKNGAEKVTVISANPSKTAGLYGVESAGMLRFFKPVLESDVLISGGGSLLQDVTSLKSLVYYLGLITTALVFRKKVVIFAQGFTPFRTRIGRLLTQMVLKRCYKITVRDSKSQILLKNMGIDSELVADPVFGLTIPKAEKRGIGVQLRDFSSLTDEFLDALALQISKRFGDEEIKLISLQDGIDLKVLEKFAQKGLRTKIVKGLTVQDAAKEIAGLEYLVAMRFHACLAGVKAGVKVLGINYDVKVKNLAESVGFPVIDMDAAGVEAGFDRLLNISPADYQIPQYKFPDTIL